MVSDKRLNDNIISKSVTSLSLAGWPLVNDRHTIDMSISSHIMIHEEDPGTDSNPGKTWADIPPKFTKLRFDTIDVLYVSPFIVRKDGHSFGMERNGEATKENPAGLFWERLKWALTAPRSQNSQIKIIAMQMNQESNTADFEALKSEESQKLYAKSVRAFFKFVHEQGLRLDGYDVDYEWNENNDGNMQDYAPRILQLVHAELKALQEELGNAAPYRMSISAATTKCLEGHPELAEILDCVNMQNYDGGKGNSEPELWVNRVGIPSSKLIWGLTAERTNKNHVGVDSVQQALVQRDKVWGNGPNAGKLSRDMMVWRLNSDNWIFEHMVLQLLQDKMHGKKSVNNLEDLVQAGWRTAGMGVSDARFTEQAWLAANRYRG